MTVSCVILMACSLLYRRASAGADFKGPRVSLMKRLILRAVGAAFARKGSQARTAQPAFVGDPARKGADSRDDDQ